MIIQGGMGVAVSNWRLAKAVALCGQLGVVSGTGIDSVMVRRLQDGDVGGHVRRAMEHFPFADIVKDTLRRYFLPDGRPADKPYARIPLATVEGNRFHRGLMALAGYTEVFLAKEGHDGPIGMNLLTKIQLPNMATLYGAMLAGVNHVLMGAGIPRDKQALIFEKFSRLTDSMQAGGAGLGLAICREIMNNLGGDITYVPGQGGAAFRVSFPQLLRPAEPDIAEAAQ